MRNMTHKTRLYLIEDDRLVLEFLEQAIQLRPDWELVGYSDTLSHARVMTPNSLADVFLVDLGLPDGRGEELLQSLSQCRPEAELLVFTVFGDESRLIRALQMGATGYVLKGCSAEELVQAIDHVRKGGAPISPLLARMLLRTFRDQYESTPGSADAPPKALLSDREAQVLKLLAQGYLNKEIAGQLGIGQATVSTHIKNLYRKLAVHSRVQVVMAAQEQGLI
jgi:DNA-binding NarL/FixJ family response regulator